MEAPKPGIYPDIPAFDYHQWKAANYSTLKKFRQSAAHARESMVNPMVQTDAMQIGQMVGEALLEPDLFAKQYIIQPDFGDRRRTANKQAFNDFAAKNVDRVIVPPDDMRKVLGMVQCISEHGIVKEIVGGSLAGTRPVVETSFVWEDGPTGVLCKGRTDVIGTLWGNPVVCDLKTTQDASPKGWPRQIAKFDYHVQAAFYLDGLATLIPLDRSWLWFCVENTRPYLAAVYQAEPALIDEGRRCYRSYLRRWKDAHETGFWAGYPADLTTVDLPQWAYTSDEDLEIE